MNELERAAYHRHRAHDRWALHLTSPYPTSRANVLGIIHAGGSYRNDREDCGEYKYKGYEYAGGS